MIVQILLAVMFINTALNHQITENHSLHRITKTGKHQHQHQHKITRQNTSILKGFQVAPGDRGERTQPTT